MLTGDVDSKPSWDYQVEEEGQDMCVTSEFLKGIPLPTSDTSPDPELLPDDPLPPPKEVINGNIKTVTEYKIEEDGKKFKIVRTFRIETRKASKAVAGRKDWKKFDNSEFDPPGPNVASTTVSDDVSMTFITSKEDLNCQEEEDPMNKLKGQKIVFCRICKGDHWTTRCPYKDTLGPMQKELAEELGLSTGRSRNCQESGTPCKQLRTRQGRMCPLVAGTGPTTVGSLCSQTTELKTMPSSVSLTCLRTLVRLTCRNSFGLLTPSLESSWPRTRPQGSPKVLLLSAFSFGRTLRMPLQGCPALATTILSSISSGPSHQ